jgi:hypothetical protein
MSQQTATATVRLTVEVRGIGNYSDECSVKRIREDASRDARLRLMEQLKGGPFKIVGDLEVIAMIAEERK